MSDLKLSTVASAYAAGASRPSDSLARLEFWVQALGDKPIDAVSADDVDDALALLRKRGRMRPVRNGAPVPTGEPLSPTTVTRYVADLAGLYRYAREHHMIRRSVTPPTKGLKVASSPMKNVFISAAQKDDLVKIARARDQRWRRMAALIEVAFSSGWRAGNLRTLRWRDVDLEAGVITAPTSKSGRPLMTPISTAAVAELKRLPGSRHPDTLVFSSANGRAFHWRRLWVVITTMAGMPEANFHSLRHGCGSALAAAGAGQAQIMQHMGHSTLVASRRYIHPDLAAQVETARRVFG